jgi:hypothetical protein
MFPQRIEIVLPKKGKTERNIQLFSDRLINYETAPQGTRGHKRPKRKQLPRSEKILSIEQN